MADRQIHPTGDEAAPADFVIPSSAELLLKMAFAKFDGSAAAGSFKPCLRIISDAGTVSGEATADNTVAAGGSADVTWFPRVGGGTSSSIIGGQIIQTYWGENTAANFTWTGPAATTVATNFPVNDTFTKLLDDTYLQIIFEGDFDPGAAADNLTLGCWLNGANRLNVAAGTVGSGAFSSVAGSALRGIPGDPVAFPAGAYTVNMRVSSFTGQTTTLRCAAATSLSITEIGPV